MSDLEELQRLKDALTDAHDVESDPDAVAAGRRVANLPD